MIDPKTLCNPPGRTRDDPGFVTRDYGPAHQDDAAKLLFWRVLVSLALIWSVGSVILIGRLLGW